MSTRKTDRQMDKMLGASAALFLLAFVAILWGATGFFGVSMDAAKAIFITLMSLSVIAFLSSAMRGTK